MQSVCRCLAAGRPHRPDTCLTGQFWDDAEVIAPRHPPIRPHPYRLAQFALEFGIPGPTIIGQVGQYL